MFNFSYAQELRDLVSPVNPQALLAGKVELINHALAEELGLPSWFHDEHALYQQIFKTDGALHKNAVAQKYGGHQFGAWNPDIGDGRGLLLAQFKTPTGSLQDLHLKGAGKTPYSRFGDGRAVLRSTLREYLASEALNALAIPTSRALCLITSNHPVQREEMEKGAMLIRSCESHLRFGHFEYFFHTQNKEALTKLFEFTYEHFYKEQTSKDEFYLYFLRDVVEKTARLIAKWQAFGFCHGVMNTDNMSIHGITFDYGPFSFLDRFEPDFICNHSDHAGRYSFEQQPGVALWNLQAFSYAFSEQLSQEQISECLAKYEPLLIEEYGRLMREKFGFLDITDKDHILINEFMGQMAKEKQDFSNSFVWLTDSQRDIPQDPLFKDMEWESDWMVRYQMRLAEGNVIPNETRLAVMSKANPQIVLRNYLAQEVIAEAEQDNFEPFKDYLNALKQPGALEHRKTRYAESPGAGQCGVALSCSS